MEAKNVIFLDGFSGSIMDVKKKDQNDLGALVAIKSDPRVSTWDMTEAWGGDELWIVLKRLELEGLIKAVEEPYPWHKYKLTKEGLARITQEDR